MRDPFTRFPRARFRKSRIAVYPIKVRWEKSHPYEEEDTELVVFPRGNGITSIDGGAHLLLQGPVRH